MLLAVIVASATGCGSKPANVAPEQPAASVQTLDVSAITDASVALGEGNRLLDENQTELAIQAFEHAIKLNPDLPEPYFQLGIAYGLLDLQRELNGQGPAMVETTDKDEKKKTKAEKAFELAIEKYEKWLEANPKDDAAYYFLGRTYSKLGNDEEAAKAFKQAVKLKAEDTEYQTELGASLVRLAQYHQAIEPLKKAIELDGSNVRAQDLLEDAQAGRQRVDYVSNKNANTSNTKAGSSNTNTAMSANSNSNTVVRPGNTNTRPVDNRRTQPTPRVPANRPN